MRKSLYFGPAAMFALWLGLPASAAWAAGAPVPPPPVPPPPPVVTFWNRLGIPQATNRIIDNNVNQSGFRPQLERKPPLLRLADPMNLQSPNPAIKAAAQIKADADLAPQKIKAIRYLAQVGCVCPAQKAEVQEALLAALEDCTEEVRYEAAIAFCQSAGRPCASCGPSCCSPAVMNKLNQMATGQDAAGCWFEPSARVRAAAENALNACRMRHAAQTPIQAAPVPAAAPTPPPATPERRLESPEVPKPPMAPPAKAPAQTQHQLHPIPVSPTAHIALPAINPAGFVQVDDHSKAPSGGLKLPASATAAETRFQGSIIPVVDLK